jgi:lysophospholipase L1-like esterase
MKIHTLLILALAPALAIAQPAAAPAASKSLTPAERFSEGWWKQRWEAKLAATKEAGKAEVVFIGDSITQGWEGAGKDVWKENYEKYAPLNLGFSGDRTEHVIWRLQTDKENLVKLKPKVAVIMIGTNNTGHEQRPADDTAAGIKAIVGEVHADWPKAKILLLAIFPRGAAPDDKLRKINDEINAKIAKFADGKTIYFQDLSSVFLAPDGTLPDTIMKDRLHPGGAGYKLWADAMAPKLKELGL